MNMTKLSMEQLASEAKHFGLLEKPVIETARAYLAKQSNGTPPNYAWFGCENDAELLAEIEQSSKANSALNGGKAFCLADEKQLRKVLDIMYCG